MGSRSPGSMGSRSSRTGNRPPDASLSRRIRVSRGRTRSNQGNTHHRSSHTVSPARGRTGSNRRSGLPNHLSRGSLPSYSARYQL
jgi:hypothetical protein